MNFGLLPLLFLISALPVSAHDLVTPVEDIPVSVIDVGPLVVPAMSFVFRDGGRGLSSQQIETDGVNTSFSEWLRCFHTGAENCQPCEADSSVVVMQDFAATRCLPPPSDQAIAFHAELTPQQRRTRDDRICQCYQEGNASPLETFSFEEGLRRRIDLRQTRFPDQVQDALDEVVTSERIATGFSAASYQSDTQAAIDLGSLYTTPVNRPITARVSSAMADTGRAVLLSVGASAGVTPQLLTAAGVVDTATSTANNFRLNEELFNGPNDPRACIPYRHFLASKQFPENPDFYRVIDEATTYRQSDWNYASLLDEFRDLKGNRGMEKVLKDHSRSNQRLQSVYARLQFLHNNPVLKNALLDTNMSSTDERQLLFDGIKRMPRPQCNETTCVRNEAWVAAVEPYRQRMAMHLRNPGILEAAQRGYAASRELQSMVALSTAQRESMTAETVLGRTAGSDAGAWSSFCRIRSGTVPPEVEYFGIMFAHLGQRNILNPMSDTEYLEENESVCGARRRDASGNVINVQDFIRITCGAQTSGRCSPANRPALVAEFLSTTTATGEQTPESQRAIANYMPILNGRAGISRIESSEVAQINQNVSNPNFIRESRVAPVAGITPQKQSGGEITNAQNIVNSSSLGLPQTPETVVVPLAASRPVAEIRENLSEGETESKTIREEISSLRDVIRNPQAAANREPQQLMDLNQRLASLERRLVTRERENNQLRDQIAEAEESSRSAPLRAQAAVDSGDQRLSSSSASSAPAVPQGGISSGVSEGTPLSGSGVQFNQNSVSGRTASNNARAVLSSGNSALLSKYNVQSGSVQGAIIVANPSATIDYQSLRSQSEGSVIPLTITAEEYNLLASNDQSALTRYLDQVRAMPGNVVRLNITSAGQQLELFILKNGNDISVIPSITAGRSPASVPVRGREFTLNSLRNELTN